MPDKILTVIECLPTELWLHLFEKYFTLKELWFSFRDLNTSINNILRQANMHLTMSSFPQKASEYRHNQILPTTANPLNVKSMTVNSLHYAEEFLRLRRFAAFSQLRSVRLNNTFVDRITYAELLSQIASLKQLRSLSVAIRTSHDTDIYFYSIDEEMTAMMKLTDIFLQSVFLEQRIPSLQRLQIHQDIIRIPSCPCLLIHPVPIMMKIEHITVGGLYFDALIKLLPYLQNVRSVRISSLKIFTGSVTPYSVLTHTAENHVKQLSNCVYFKASVQLKSTNGQFDQIESLLKMLPVVRNLHLGQLCVCLLETAKWTCLLSKLCLKLSKLSLEFENRLPFKREVEYAQKTLESCPFWLDRQAKSEYHEHRSNTKFTVGFDLKVSSV